MKIEGCSRVPHNRSPPLGSPQPPPLSQVITLPHDDDHFHLNDDDFEVDCVGYDWPDLRNQIKGKLSQFQGKLDIFQLSQFYGDDDDNDDALADTIC